MKNIILSLLFLLALNFLSFSLFAQKHFKIIVRPPQTINSKKMEAWVNDGKEAKKIRAQSLTEAEMVLTGNYYSFFRILLLAGVSGNRLFFDDNSGFIGYTIDSVTWLRSDLEHH